MSNLISVRGTKSWRRSLRQVFDVFGVSSRAKNNVSLLARFSGLSTWNGERGFCDVTKSLY